MNINPTFNQSVTMNRIIISIIGCVMTFAMSSCLSHGAEDIIDSDKNELTNVTYTYRFFYNDTIKKGTPNEEIQNDRVCEVIFTKDDFSKIEKDGLSGFSTTINHNLNSVQKAGPQGSVTKAQLYEMFKQKIKTDGLSRLVVYVSISDAAVITPVDGAPRLGAPGDFSQDRIYSVRAANGDKKEYILRTIKGF